jgi:formylglycine-generating enzyme required for sulfatase activity
VPGATWKDPVGFKQTDDHPAMCISWNDAKAFCDWAAKKTGREVRLPTEAEWEYACRARTKTRWWFGDTESSLTEYAWTNANAGWQTQPTGQKKPNPWGLYDMYGNVWQWCQDWAAPYPAADVVDPTGPSGGGDKCLRGGSFMHDAIPCSSAFRDSHAPINRSTDAGFRVCVP